jgi:hypothetical protein
VKRAVLLYGLGGGILILVLRLTEYRSLIVEHSVESRKLTAENYRRQPRIRKRRVG